MDVPSPLVSYSLAVVLKQATIWLFFEGFLSSDAEGEI
jgi:hypothetical protein